MFEKTVIAMLVITGSVLFFHGHYTNVANEISSQAAIIKSLTDK